MEASTNSNFMNYETETLAIITEYLKKINKNPENLTLDTELVNADIDSLDTIEICFLLEKSFDTSIEVDELMSCNAKTIRDLIFFIQDAKTNQ